MVLSHMLSHGLLKKKRPLRDSIGADGPTGKDKSVGATKPASFNGLRTRPRAPAPYANASR